MAAAAVALAVGAVRAQSLTSPYAALPHLPYWWAPDGKGGIEVLPLVWFNEIDGASSGCCVVGASARYALGTATLWLGLGFGTRGGGGQPAALELDLELPRAALSYRQLHGRNAFTAAYRVFDPQTRNRPSLSLAAGSLWLADTRYLQEAVLFDCPTDAPSAPCTPLASPLHWSRGRDNAIAAILESRRDGTAGASVKVRGQIGLEALGGDHDYLRLELEADVEGEAGPNDWWARLSAGWVSEEAPQQRRFRLDGADPVTRWLNPYLDARGGLLTDVPYFLPGGGHVRAYEETSPLIKRYVGIAGRVGRRLNTKSGVWGRVSVFTDAAWTPGLADRIGPDDLRPGSDLIFDWTRLREGEGAPRGRFRARVLEVPPVWADAGFAITGGYERLFVNLSFPIWASAPEFAGGPVSSERSAFALRWNVTIGFSPQAGGGGE